MTIYDLFSEDLFGEPEPFVEAQASSKRPQQASNRETRIGHFTDVTDTLLPLFNDPDGRGSRRWREMFGLERPLPRKRRGAFIASEALR